MRQRIHFHLVALAAVAAAMILFAGTALAVEDGWYTDGDKTYYYENGVTLKGWARIDGNRYHFNKNGTMSKAPENEFLLKKIGNYHYLFNDKGMIQTGWQTVDGKEMYFHSELGKCSYGIKSIQGTLFYFDDQGVLQKNAGWKNISGDEYYLRADGTLVTGMFKTGGKTYYFDSSGKNRTGWISIDGSRYYFKKGAHGRGVMMTGLKSIGSSYYFFGTEETAPGPAQSGWKSISGNRYYFSSKDYKASKGLTKIDGKYYYFNSRGKMLTGWVELNGNTYYFSKNSQRFGQAVTGLGSIGSDYYHFTVNGKLQKGCWKTINGNKYYFSADSGKALKGLKKVGENLYFFNKKGVMQTGWKVLDGVKYYFDRNTGKAASGLVEINGGRYFFNSDRKMQTGWQEVDGQKMYFKTGVLKKTATGKAATGLFKVSDKTYLADSKGKQITKTGTYDGKYVIFKSNGDLLTGKGWTWYNGYRYYIKNDGYTVLTDTQSLVGGPYVLKVNKTQCMVNVMAYNGDTGNYDIPVRSFVCSPGHSTPVKRCYLSDMYRWHELNGPVWGQWCVRYNTGMLFHSVYYGVTNDANTLSVYAWNDLGTIASHGCIRLEAINAKWVYDHKSQIRYVDIYEDSDPGPFGKVWAVKLPSWHTWDPTDPYMHHKCIEKGCHE